VFAYMREMSRIDRAAFRDFPRTLAPGQTERAVYRAFHTLLIDLGADEIPYLIPVSGRQGYDQINTSTQRRRIGYWRRPLDRPRSIFMLRGDTGNMSDSYEDVALRLRCEIWGRRHFS
jgi:Xaa-Pro aminopeptidase